MSIHELTSFTRDELKPLLRQLTDEEKNRLDEVLKLRGENLIKDLRDINSKKAAAELKRALSGQELPQELLLDEKKSISWLAQKIEEIAKDTKGSQTSARVPASVKERQQIERYYGPELALAPAYRQEVITEFGDLEKAGISRAQIKRDFNEIAEECRLK